MVEGFEEVLWDELAESLLQSQKLGFDSTHKPPVHIKSENTNTNDEGQINTL